MIEPTRPPKRKRKPAKTPKAAQRRKQRLQAIELCVGAGNDQSRRIADRMALAWCDCDCDELLAEVEVTQPDLLDRPIST